MEYSIFTKSLEHEGHRQLIRCVGRLALETMFVRRFQPCRVYFDERKTDVACSVCLEANLALKSEYPLTQSLKSRDTCCARSRLGVERNDRICSSTSAMSNVFLARSLAMVLAISLVLRMVRFVIVVLASALAAATSLRTSVRSGSSSWTILASSSR